jgi:hypothetical protein
MRNSIFRTSNLTRPNRRIGSAGRLGIAALTGLALTLGTTTAPAQATELVPQTESEAKQLVKDRAAEDASSLDRSSVPNGLSVAQAKKAVEDSDEISADDIKYAAAQEDLPDSGVPEGFYSTPTSMPDEDGSLVKQSESDFYVDPVKLIKYDADTTTYMYKTTDEHGVARAATASLLTPKGAEGSAKEAVVISPGTQGIADKCAPSHQLGMGTEYESISVASALATKRPVVVIDYMGLGTEGPHSYLNRTEEGRSVLDAARAVQQIDGGVIDKDTKLQLRGYSQGGQATASALELAEDWAPELNISSASAGAAPTDIAGAISHISDTYKGLMLFGYSSISEQTDTDVSKYLNDKGVEAVKRAAGQCTVEAAVTSLPINTKSLTKDGRDITDVMTDEFDQKLEEQRLGKAPVPDIPLLVNHSRLDDVVPFEQGKELASTWCRAGHKVAFKDNLGPTHIGGYVVALPRIEAFTDRTFAGKDPLESCWRL